MLPPTDQPSSPVAASEAGPSLDALPLLAALAIVLRPGRVLTKNDIVFVEQLLPPWAAAARRLARRDKALQAVAAAMPPRAPTVLAKQIERALSRYLAGSWRSERDLAALPESAGALRAAMHRLAHENAGEPLGWRQVCRVLTGARS